MQTFLQHVAASLLEKFGNNLSNVTVVFPGKRAGLFLEQALAQTAKGPVWSPRYSTISELFSGFSPYTLCDSVEAVCRLHRAYKHRMELSAQQGDDVERPQGLDQFYGWGEILLSDFDDIDKHLVDAHRLFANIHDLRALDDASYITEEQEAALRRFFANFSVAATTELRQRFLRLWLNMGEIYDEFRRDMLADGVLYEGALQRLVVEQGIPQTNQTYAFVGFNVLNDVEMALFDQLRSRQQALFYWDYDVYYTSKRDKRVQEAGLFMRRNLERYGNELDSSLFNNLNTPKEIVFVTSSTETVQTRYIPHWLQKYRTTPDNQTAVVLCNEHLLQPTLQSLPSGQVNITMGFPLADTPVCTFVNELLALYTDGFDTRRRRFRYPYLRRLLCHPYASVLTLQAETENVLSGVELITHVIDVVRQVGVQIQQSRKLEQPSTADILNAEAVFKAYTLLNRILSLMTGEAPLLDVSDSVLCRIVRAAMQQQTIPFHGEPATGLQVMGVLETRALDFRHVLMLSVGEGFLPRNDSDVSFIPYSLREAFGLTTVRHKTAVYAYYFYRLLQRAESITYVFNNSTAGVRQNEMSRFLRQLMAETDFPIRHLFLQSEQQFSHPQEMVIAKTDDMLASIRESLTSHTVSPTALNTYTTCPMQFYYKYVRGLRVDPDPEDGLDQLLFGNIFHRAAELAYKHLKAKSRIVQAADLRNLIDSEQMLDSLVDAAFEKEFFKGRKAEYTGILIIARRVVLRFLIRLLRYDLQHAPITILGLEQPTSMSINVGNDKLSIGGYIDRVDQITTADGQTLIRIVDYKTGSQPASNNITSFSALFKASGQKEHYCFQTMLYAISTARKLGIHHSSSDISHSSSDISHSSSDTHHSSSDTHHSSSDISHSSSDTHHSSFVIRHS
ncbi:MAG: PD-(D/E)XK nuclease family protein, partial [Bacteroidaceae bacterium]|nr:PD-(D/E)XK nuclease family protein [Bacteroidaceae bacterium]